MAKAVKKKLYIRPELIVDRVFIVMILLAAAGYIIRTTWLAMFLFSGALGMGFIWTYRAITTHPRGTFRFFAVLLMFLLWALLALYLGKAQGLITTLVK